MRVYRILGVLFVVAAIYLFIFTERESAAMLFLVTGNGFAMVDHHRHGV